MITANFVKTINNETKCKLRKLTNNNLKRIQQNNNLEMQSLPSFMKAAVAWTLKSSASELP